MPSRLPHSLPSDRRTPGPKPKTARSPKNKIVKKDRPPRGAQTAPFGGQSFCDAPARERRSVVPGSAARMPCIAGRGRGVTDKRQPSASPTKGPMQASAPTQRGDTPQPSSTRYACRPLVLPPACLALQGGRSRPPGGLVPARKYTRKARYGTFPYRGGFIGGSFPKASPARGGGCAARRRRRGALPGGGGDILQSPAGLCPASVGDDACIVPESPAAPQPPSGGRKRLPYKAAASGRWISASLPPAPTQGNSGIRLPPRRMQPHPENYKK